MSSDLDAAYARDNHIVDTVACPFCGERKGSRCRKPSGSVTPAHAARAARATKRAVRRIKVRRRG